MYEGFFGVSRPPFLTTPDPGLLFPTRGHREALDGLSYAVLGRKGLALVAGEAGTGKTTLLRAMMAAIPEERARFGIVVHPTLDSGSFLEMSMLALGMEDVPEGKPRRLVALERHLLREQEAGRATVLLLDEAHRLSGELLEEVRLLANLESRGGQLLQIVLSGQMELASILNRPDLRQLEQRLAHRFTVRPLRPQDVPGYVSYRWARAGAFRPHPFGEDALDYLAVFSGGVPRLINTICDNALLAAYGGGRREVRPEDIVGAAKNLAWAPADEVSGYTQGGRRAEMAVVWSKPKWQAGSFAPA
jgi:general secretion pathway protein A